MSPRDARAQNRRKLQDTLRELFQFDHADLDFGIYRIMNQKRKEIERFIERDLLDAVSEGLSQFQSAEREELERQLGQKRQALGDEALDDGGAVRSEFQRLPIAREYMALRERLQELDLAEETEARILNDLWRFFSRYYDDGDFLPERRYSSREPKFAVPYNGEEVLLHWANRDQYYVKTSEYFVDYLFAADGYSAWFRLQRADVPPDNVKGEKRYFVPRAEEPLTYDAEERSLTVWLEYRPLQEGEEQRFLDAYNAEQPKSGQRKSIDRNVVCMVLERDILAGLEPKALRDALARPCSSEDGRSLLGRHLNRYTARNTMDYFIHKDLGGFLRRELDFFLKNEVLRLDDVVADPTGKALQAALTRMRVVRRIGERIIAFLAQIENLQKRLFEKKKFVVETRYCVAVGQIPDSLYSAIAENDSQWSEWEELLHLGEKRHDLFTGAAHSAKHRRMELLRAHPTLLVDTAHFDPAFTANLLATFEDLDSVVDGVVIHGENFQALNLLRARYRDQFACIHIDPPYNTQTSGFLYKNAYQHSSWLAMMKDRIDPCLDLLTPEGAFLCHIDENEYEALHMLLEGTGLPNGGTIIWDKKNPMLGRKGIATQHEYVAWRTLSDSSVYVRPVNVRRIIAKARSLIHHDGGVNDEVRREFSAWLASADGLSGGDRAYRFIDDEGRVFRGVAMGAPEPRRDPKFHIPLVHPVTGKPCPVPPNGWSRTPETLHDLMVKGEILFGEDETVQPQRKVFLGEDSRRQLSSVISDTGRGKSDLAKLGLEFPYCHPASLYVALLGAAAPGLNDMVLDHFAGSGTTAHAVITLNREDGGRRAFVLVEVGEYVETVLLPRIKKVAFAPDWRNGRPVRMLTAEEAERSPHVIKVLRLESYDDALNNIAFRPLDDAQRSLLYDTFDDYMLHYMLEVETRDSPTLLRPEAFVHPFDYTLKIQRGHQTPQDTQVDLVETFHYLLGMHVRRLERYEHQGRRYVVSRGEVRDERAVEQVVVVWRDAEGLDLEQEADWANETLLTEPVDRVYVNGPSLVRHAEPLEITFRDRMFGGLDGR